MKKPGQIIATAILIASIVSVVGASPRETRPNVLMIIVDDLNDWTGHLKGHPQTKTPNIDRLAARSVSFTNAHCSAPLCGPSRTSMWSGLYPHNTGVYGHIHDGDLGKVKAMKGRQFLPQFFKSKGYKTLGVGKIFHITDGKQFDEYGGIFERMGPKPPQRLSYDPSKFGKGSTQTDWGAYPEKSSDMPDHKIAKWSVGKLQEKHTEPFFMTVGFVRPHVPWHVPAEWFKPFPVKDTKLPPLKDDDLTDISTMGHKVHAIPGMPPWEWMKKEDRIRAAATAYLACVHFVDAQVGKVLKALEESPYADNTIVILTSDHGYHLGEKQRWAKHSLWERATRVPLLIHVPGAGVKFINEPVGLIDLYPTLTDLCGLEISTELDGQSIKPLLEGEGPEWRHSVMTIYGRGNVALRSKNFRYIRYEDGSEELYNMHQDPNEWDNLCFPTIKPEVQPVIDDFRKRIPKSFQHWSPYSYANINPWFDADIKASRKVTGRKPRSKYK
jgi:arylsulfatase A-like enzyme